MSVVPAATSRDSVFGMKRDRGEAATAGALLVFGAFQVALAAGAPWGRAAYGGSRHGTLPGHLRVISSVAALGYGTAAVLIVGDVGLPKARRRAFTALSIFMAVGTAANGASRSPVERKLWTPLAAATSALAWRSHLAET